MVLTLRLPWMSLTGKFKKLHYWTETKFINKIAHGISTLRLHLVRIPQYFLLCSNGAGIVETSYERDEALFLIRGKVRWVMPVSQLETTCLV